MGCDIHLRLERKAKGQSKWQDCHILDYDRCWGDRIYGMFAALADVRNYNDIEHLPVRGIPKDATELTLMLYGHRIADKAEYDWHNVHSGTPLTCEEGGELMDVRPVDESEPEAVDYWTATDPDGRQLTFLSKPVRRQWANGWEWEPSAGGSYIGTRGTVALMELLGLPKLTWEDEPYKFTVLKPERK